MAKKGCSLVLLLAVLLIAGGSVSADHPRVPHQVMLQGGLPVGPTTTVGVDGINFINNRATLTLIITGDHCGNPETHQVLLHAIGATGSVLATKNVVVPGCKSKRFDLFNLFGAAADGAVIASESSVPHAVYACLRPEFKTPTPATECRWGVPKRNRTPEFSLKPWKQHLFFGIGISNAIFNGANPPFWVTASSFHMELVNPGRIAAAGTVMFYPVSGPPMEQTFVLPPGGSQSVQAPSDFDGDIEIESNRAVIAAGYLTEFRIFCGFCDKPAIVEFPSLRQ